MVDGPAPNPPPQWKLVHFTMSAIVVALTIYMLVVGQRLFLPLVIAIVVWFLINVLANGFARLRVAGVGIPRPLCFVAAIMVFFAVVAVIIQFVTLSLNDLGSVGRVYEANLREYWASLPFAENVPSDSYVQVLLDWFDISAFVTTTALTFTSLAADSVLIFIYVGFLLYEQGNFDSKMSALIANEDQERRTRRLITRIREDIQKYISIKTLISAMTGVVCYVILRVLGVDFPEIWAILIFLLNFIPTVGSIIATVFPTLIALAQSPDGYYPALLVLICVGTVQLVFGNILEPRLMGTSLNLSPVVIVFNLALWGYIWGVAGMFLCVPFLIITTIVLSHFPKTRPIAILLSSNGRVDFADD